MHEAHRLALLHHHERRDGGGVDELERGGGERVVRPATSPSELARVVTDILDVIASGAFVHTNDDQDCSFCELRPACGRNAVQQAKSKIENPANAILACFKRLRGHA